MTTKIEWGQDYYCPNCGKVNGATGSDIFASWVCKEIDKLGRTCNSSIRKDEKYNWKGLDLRKDE